MLVLHCRRNWSPIPLHEPELVLLAKASDKNTTKATGNP